MWTPCRVMHVRTYPKRRGVRRSHVELRTNFILDCFCMCLCCGWVHWHVLFWGWGEASGCPMLWGCSMVCFGKNIATCSKDRQFLPAMCVLSAHAPLGPQDSRVYVAALPTLELFEHWWLHSAFFLSLLPTLRLFKRRWLHSALFLSLLPTLGLFETPCFGVAP